MQGYDSCLSFQTMPRNIGCDEERGELGRLLADPEFHCTERNKRFLEFISEELFAGRHAAIKAYTIAVDVFGRSPSFDPSIDPIVRIEATRLRTALARYYEHHGQKHRIHINLPRGRYVPEFVRGGDTACNQNPALRNSGVSSYSDEFSTSTRNQPRTERKWITLFAGIAGGFLLGAALATAVWLRVSGTETPPDHSTDVIRVVATN